MKKYATKQSKESTFIDYTDLSTVNYKIHSLNVSTEHSRQKLYIFHAKLKINKARLQARLARLLDEYDAERELIMDLLEQVEQKLTQ